MNDGNTLSDGMPVGVPAAWTAEVAVEVPFHDLDPLNIVWHGRYAKYFELARCALMDQLGFDQLAVHGSQHYWPLIDLRIQYVRPARYRQKLLVRATLREYEHRLKIRYEIRDAVSGARVTKGYTCQVAVRREDDVMLMSSPPEVLRKLGVPLEQ